MKLIFFVFLVLKALLSIEPSQVKVYQAQVRLVEMLPVDGMIPLILTKNNYGMVMALLNILEIKKVLLGGFMENQGLSILATDGSVVPALDSELPKYSLHSKKWNHGNSRVFICINKGLQNYEKYYILKCESKDIGYAVGELHPVQKTSQVQDASQLSIRNTHPSKSQKILDPPETQEYDEDTCVESFKTYHSMEFNSLYDLHKSTIKTLGKKSNFYMTKDKKVYILNGAKVYMPIQKDKKIVFDELDNINFQDLRRLGLTRIRFD